MMNRSLVCLAWCLATLCFLLRVPPSFGQSDPPKTEWTVLAGRDDFTDESYFIVLPALPYPETVKEKPITDQERRKAISEVYGPGMVEQMMRVGTGALDGLVKAARMKDPNGPFMLHQKLIMDKSCFLRPFVAVDNGVVVAGATTIGKVGFEFEASGARTLVSQVGPMSVQLRIGESAPMDLDPVGNPPMKLPGATDMLGPSLAPPSQNELEKAFAEQKRQGSPYTAVAGPPAEVLLEQMLGGESVKLRRKPNSDNASDASFSAAKSFSLGAGFRSAVDRIGLRKNGKTGKWELDPSKEAARKELLSAAAARRQ